MISDWVEGLDSTHETRVYVQIEAIEEYGSILVKEDIANRFLDIKQLEPIPLTDEILETNFSWFENKNHERVYEWTNDYIDAYISLYTDGMWEVTVDEIEFSGLPTWKMYVSHVHELQHALKLANIDKDIEL